MSRVFVIAEAGVNHNGSLARAKSLVAEAAAAGADAVKFQTFKARELVSVFAPKAAYQLKFTPSDESQLEMIQELELDVAAHQELLAYCQKQGIKFLSTPFDMPSIDLLNDLGLDIFKIPSGEIVTIPYLRKIGALKKRVILSTGMADLGEIEDALAILINNGTLKENITVMHCNAEYPSPMADVNLLAMVTIREAFKINVGYSDHTLGIEVPIAAVALGATVIEKHFTLDRTMPGPDHPASLEPHEFTAMVKAIRNIEIALGDGVKRISPSEEKNKVIARKSIVASKFIRKGEIFSETNLSLKRPGSGISPIWWDWIMGKPANKDFQPDEFIEI